VLDLKKESDSKYRISMSGSDEVGTSKLNGLLMFRADGMGLKLSKVYDDRSKAGQTGSFSILLYEGSGIPDKIEGEWAYKGYETSMQYSGTWTCKTIHKHANKIIIDDVVNDNEGKMEEYHANKDMIDAVMNDYERKMENNPSALSE
jgi:hypothetical protein